MSFKKLVSSSICTAILCTAVSAQETKPKPGAFPQQANPSQGVSKGVAQGLVTQQQLAECWALDNQVDVVLANFAQENTKNKEVSEFAKMIAEEHQGLLKKLSKLAPEASREGYLTGNQSEQSRSRNEAASTATSATDQAKKSSASGSVPALSGIDMVQLQREIAEQCISDSKKYLSKKDANEFDKCFVGMQIARHAAMHSKLVVLQRHVSDDMQQMVADGIQAIEKHMKTAETLMAKVDVANANTLSETNRK